MPDEGLSTEGKIEIEVSLKNLQSAIDGLHNLDAATGGNVQGLKNLLTATEPVDRLMKSLNSTLNGTTGAARAQITDFKQLTDQVNAYTKTLRAAAQTNLVATNPQIGTGPGMTSAQAHAIQDAVAAGNVNAVTMSSQIVSAEAKQAAETTAMWDAVRKRRIDNELAVTAETARQSQIQGDARRAATAEAIAAIEKERQAFTAAYTAELNAALRVDEEIAASQQARRFAPGGLNTAAANTANPTAMMAAQQEYAAQATKELSDDFRAQESAARGSGQGITSLAYSLFNLSFMAGTASAGLIAMDVATIKTAADYQRGFADVARTSGVAGAAADMLKQSLIELSTAIPVTFDDIAKIATLAGQLDISAGDIENFSKATAMFSATSNVGVEDAATALGRLGQLLPDVQGNYDQLASTILKVGVNSVATESQIIAISTQIAGLAAGARLTTPDVIALSGALASVGVQPERSRGLVTRLFTNIEVAVASGGNKLRDFGAISGQTAEQFANSWKTAPLQAVSSILNGIKAQGDGAIGTMKALGIASSRDIPAIQNLMAQPGLLAKMMKESSGEWVQQTELTKQFGVIADTVSSRLVVLQNNFKAMIDAAGSSADGPFIGLINGLDDFLKLATKIISSPMGQWFTVGAIGATVLAGAFLALAAGTAITAAGLLLLKSAADKLVISEGAATVATNVFKGALVATGIGAIVVLLGTLVSGVMAANGAFDTGKDRAEEYFGSIDGITKGMQADQAEYERTGKAIRQVGTEQGTATVHADAWVQALHDVTGAQVGLNSNTTHTTEAIKRQTIAYGDNAKAAVASALANSKQIQNLFKPGNAAGAALKQGGGSATGLVEAILGDPVKGGTDYVNKVIETIKAKMAAMPPTASALVDMKGLQAALDSLRGIASAGKDAAQSGAAAVAAWAATSGNAAQSTGAWSDQIAGATGNITTLSDQINENVKAAFESVNAQATLSDSTERLGEAFVNSGSAAASQGAELQAVIAAILDPAMSAGPGDAANMLQGFFNSLVAGGKASADQLSILQTVIDGLAQSAGKDFTLTPKTFDMTPFIQGQRKAQEAIQKTQAAAEKAAKAVRTYVDYANDLKGVFDRTFDIQFGPEAARDALTTAEHDIQKGFEEADQKVRDLRKQLSGLEDDLKTSYAKTYAEQFKTLLGDGLSKALEQAFGKQTALDNITTTERGIQKGFDDANQKVRDLRKQLSGLQDDLKTSYAKTFTEQFNTLLGDGLSKALENAFGRQTAVDNITTAVRGLEGALADSRQKLDELHSDMASLSADRKVKEYWLSVAKNYGDALRADQLRADLKKIDADQAANARSVQQEQANTSRALNGNSDASIKNRGELLSLVNQYLTYIKTLSDTNVSSKVLSTEIQKSQKSFMTQAESLGFARDQLKSFNNLFDAFNTSSSQAALKANRLALDAQKTAQGAVKQTTGDLKQAEEDASHSLDGNSDASIKNRSNLLTLVGQYIDYIKTLADTGVSSKALDTAIQTSRSNFDKQAKSLGFAHDQLKDFDDMFAAFSTSNSQAALEANRLALVAQKAAQDAVEQTAKDLKQAEDDASRSLDGDSDAAIRNRKAVRDLVQKNQDYLVALANSGASQDTLRQKSGQLRDEFGKQLTKVGLSKTGIDKYKGAFDQLTLAIDGVPQNVTVTMHAGTSAASLALDEYKAKLDAISNGHWGGGTIASPSIGNSADLAAAVANVDYYAGVVSSLSVQRPLPGAALDSADSSLMFWKQQVHNLRGYFDGGYVGDGDKYQPMGVVHGGEFVFTKEETTAIGPQNLATIASMAFSHNMSKGSSAPVPGSGAGFGNGVVQLSPYDRQLLIDIRDRQAITLNGSAMQRFASAGNINSNNRGAA